jgi:hypothetical protein
MTTFAGIQPIDEMKLESLMSVGNFKAAKVLMESFLNQELSAEEKGQIYTQIISTYLAVSNKMNEEYLSELDKSVAAIKKFKEVSKKTEDKMRIDELQTSLASEEPQYEDDGL